MNFLANGGYLADSVRASFYATSLWTTVKFTMNEVKLPPEHPLLPKAFQPIAQKTQLKLLKTGTPRALSGFTSAHDNIHGFTSFGL